MPIETPDEPKKYTTVYSDFRGVDFTNDSARVWKRRSPTGLNIIPDMNGLPMKRTGWNVEVTQAMFKTAYPYAVGDVVIKNIYSFELGGKDHMIIFCNCGVFAFTNNELTHLVTLSSITDEPYRGFYYEGNGTAGFYFFGNKQLYAYKHNESTGGFSCGTVTPYIPTTIIGRSATGGGTVYESVNLMTRRRKEMFLGDDTSLEYYLSMGVDSTQNVIVKVKDSNGDFQTVTDFTLNVATSSITFTSAKPPVVTGEDNIMVEYAASTYSAAVDAFFDCKTVALYGTGLINAVFVGGCDDDDFSSRVWYSKTGDPTYFPDLNYFVAGSNDTKIMGLIKVGEYLGCVKQGSAIDSTIYLAYPVSFDDDTAYAVKQSVTGIGALSKRCFANVDDASLFLSQEGVMAIEPTATESERQVKNRSFYVNKKMLAENNIQNAFAYVWNGLYILCVNSHCYVLDSSQKSSWANEKTNLQYEAYYWENIPAVAFATYNDFLWFGDTSGNLCRFKTVKQDGMNAYSDNGTAIKCEWSTIFDNDGATNFYKNLQKKGCLVTIQPMESTGVDVYVRADDKDEVPIGSITVSNVDVPQEFYLNKKIKKYKRLQIIVRNNGLNQGFGLQEIIKLYTLGNYSKNRGGTNG